MWGNHNGAFGNMRFILNRQLPMKCLNMAMDAGFLSAPETLQSDPWLEALREHPEFDILLGTVKRIAAESRMDVQGFARH